SEPEFDYPRGDGNVTTTYQGTAGVNVGSFWRKLLYALYFRDPNLLLSSALRQDSAILYRRDIVERVERIAPFLVLDSDPYLVVADGQLWWMIDAYTTSDRFPYSQPLAPGGGAPGLNYIRNSVKITVNAYDGSVGLYQADSQDPLLRAYAAMFPGLLRPLAEMPASLRAHIRYPEDLFRVQAYIFQTFHMQDPRVFYNKEDVWDVPFEKLYGQQEPVDPYYVIMRLPNASHGEFLLMQPFTPRSKDNMIAWLAGRSDGDSYGKLLVYKYPKEKLVYGPLQVEGRIDQDPQISAQFTLWSTAGSQVIRGNLLVIPIGTSNLYVEPIYLQAQNGRIPELKRVVVSTGSRVVMEPSLREALASLYRDQPAAERGATTAPQAVLTSGSTDVAALAREARAHYERAPGRATARSSRRSATSCASSTRQRTHRSESWRGGGGCGVHPGRARRQSRLRQSRRSLRRASGADRGDGAAARLRLRRGRSAAFAPRALGAGGDRHLPPAPGPLHGPDSTAVRAEVPPSAVAGAAAALASAGRDRAAAGRRAGGGWQPGLLRRRVRPARVPRR